MGNTRSHPAALEPPIEMPPSRTVRVVGRGEFFLRDSGGSGPPVMLLHGWMVNADLNWWTVYGDLIAAGYRVLAIDHRGHGRGLRPLAPFRLADCAADAAAVLAELGLGSATAVGYSMGGAIAQLMARDHSEACNGVVLSGTAQHWQDRQTKRAMRAMGMIGLMLAVAPQASYRFGMRRSGLHEAERKEWVQSELMRGEPRDLAEAGREIGRFDSRPWLGGVTSPTAVLVTTRDEIVPPRRQRALAEAARAQVFEAPVTHLELSWPGTGYGAALVEAIGAVSGRAASQAA